MNIFYLTMSITSIVVVNGQLKMLAYNYIRQSAVYYNEPIMEYGTSRVYLYYDLNEGNIFQMYHASLGFSKLVIISK